MAYSAYAVANAFVHRASEGLLPQLSPMKLQKLLYYAQAWHLRVTKTPLLDDNFARWKFGPVIPSIYHEFKDYGYRPITAMATTLARRDDGGYATLVPKIPADDRMAWTLVDAIIRRFGGISAQDLSEMTHRPGSAWAAGLKDGVADGSVITHAEMLDDKTF